jgi:hypothetical protein
LVFEVVVITFEVVMLFRILDYEANRFAERSNSSIIRIVIMGGIRQGVLGKTRRWPATMVVILLVCLVLL